jgi:hypothetical protein
MSPYLMFSFGIIATNFVALETNMCYAHCKCIWLILDRFIWIMNAVTEFCKFFNSW